MKSNKIKLNIILIFVFIAVVMFLFVNKLTTPRTLDKNELLINGLFMFDQPKKKPKYSLGFDTWWINQNKFDFINSQRSSN